MEKTEIKNVISCIVSPDKMSVRLILAVDADFIDNLHIGDVLNELDRLEVTHGIEEAVIEGTIEFYNEYTEEEDVVIAKGTSPQHGTVGRVQCLLKKPEMNIDVGAKGSINFRDINTITRIAKGHPLYRITPPEPGIDGKDVFGNPVKPREYDRVYFPGIENTETDKNNPNLLVSTIDGSVIFTRDGIKISKCHMVSGNVDYSTGNIKYDGPVKIRGDVKSGFKVQAKDSVEVDGTVEDATIITEGDVTVKCGFVGTGKGLIKAGGEVRVGFVRNQKIESRGSIYVAKEALDSKLYSKSKIFVASKGLALAGGYAFAIEGMELAALGSETEVKTEIQVGSDPKIKAAIEAIDGNIELLSKKGAVLESQLKEIERSKKKSKDLFEKLIEKMEKVMEAKMNIEMKVSELKEKKGFIEREEGICANPILKVYGTVYPGIALSFHNFKRLIDEKTNRKMFYLDKGDIRDSVITAE